jgi:hypothetical protein
MTIIKEFPHVGRMRMSGDFTGHVPGPKGEKANYRDSKKGTRGRETRGGERRKMQNAKGTLGRKRKKVSASERASERMACDMCKPYSI